MGANTRRNAVAGLWDAPLRRDWAAWQMLWWLLCWGIVIFSPAPKEGTTDEYYSIWFNLFGGFAVLGTFAVLPPLIRLLLRRATAARRERRERRLVDQPTEPRLPRPTFEPDRYWSVTGNRPVPPGTPTPIPSAPAGPATPAQLDPVRPLPGMQPLPTKHPSTSEPGIRPGGVTAPRAVAVPPLPAELGGVDRSYPYPIAAAARKLLTATDLKTTYEAVLDLGETLTVCLGSVVAAVSRDLAEGTPAVSRLKEAYATRGVSVGHWQAVTQDARQLSGEQLAVIPGLAESVRARKRGSGLPEQLGLLVRERNRWAHGGRFPSHTDLVDHIGASLPPLMSALDQAAFLVDSPWMFVEDSSFRRDTATFWVRAQQAMGSHPDFDVDRFESAEPLADEVLYARTPTSMARSPFVVLRECPTCRRAEIFHADRLVDGHVVLKSFGKGHELHDTGLAAELKTAMMALPGQV
jgi:hypothetical protein